MAIFEDLREFIQRAAVDGELKIVEGADRDLEIGTITEIAMGDIANPPVLLFDKIPGFPAGYRVCSSLFTTQRRTALALNVPGEPTGTDLVDAWRKRMRTMKPVPPVEVKSGPVFENVFTGDDVNMLKFPVPKWHELDGGRYIGTGHAVIMKDPESGYVNIGTYRIMEYDEKTLIVYIVKGKHADIIRKKYWEKGKSCPVAVSFGQDPAIFAMSSNPILQWEAPEYDYVGWLRGEPVKVVKGPLTGLPIPATAEIVIEGEMPPPSDDTMLTEGPFGEWLGYYASGARLEPIIKVKALYHRNDPILQGNPPLKPPINYTLGGSIVNAAYIWDEVDKQVPGICGVWVMDQAGYMSRMFCISVKQQHPGHAARAGLLATSCYAAAYAGRFCIVVDDDINPSNIGEVLWAIGTRCDPETDIQILNQCWSSEVDPRITPWKRENGDLTGSKAIIYACKTYYWKHKFPPVVTSSPELKDKVMNKWYDFLLKND
jgi:UbiD family decarboxylase